MKNLSKSIEFVYADSSEHDKAKNNYLLGGIMNCIRGNAISLHNSIKIVVSKLGNWIAMQLLNEHKIILYITLYRIPLSSTQGIYNSLAQYN